MAYRQSSLVLILANLVPLVGVLLFDWSVLDILVLYWAENVVIGLVNVLRMLSNRPDGPTGRLARATGAGGKAFFVLFFSAHYGGFCFGHLAALLSLFGDGTSSIDAGLAALDVRDPWFLAAVGAIFISHLFSFFMNYIGAGEYRNTSLPALMTRPYGRIVIMHVTIIVGALLVQLLGDAVGLLVALVALKILVDLYLHRKERRGFSVPASTSPTNR